MFTLKSQQSDYSREENRTMWENHYRKPNDGFRPIGSKASLFGQNLVSYVCRGLMAAALLFGWSCSTRVP